LREIVSEAGVKPSSATEEQQAVGRLFYHVQSNRQYMAALALALHGACDRQHIAPRRTDNLKSDLRLTAQF
jgi:hypothetical protein